MIQRAVLVLAEGLRIEVDLRDFSGAQTTLTLEQAPPVPAADVAFVGFLRGESAGTPSDVLRLPRYRLHFPGAETLMARARPLDLTGHGQGFYAWPAESSSEFRVVFVYRHALVRAEDPTLAGELLVAAGHVTQADVAAAVAVQQARVGDILVGNEVVERSLVDAAAALQARKQLRLGDILLEAGLVTPEQLAEALAEQRRRKGRRLGEILVDQGVLDERALTEVLARKFGMPVIDLDQCAIDPAAVALLPADLIARYNVLPIAVEADRVTVVILDPLVHELHDVVRFSLPRKRILEVLAVPSQLHRRIAAALAPPSAVPEEASHTIGMIVADIVPEEPAPAPSEGGVGVESDSALVRLVNQILIDGIKAGASDIHLEPDVETGVLVRFRIDGECRIHTRLPSSIRHPLAARIKILAELDISERRRPQDGKMRFKYEDRVVELRVASFPTIRGNEDLVLRILASATPLPMEQMSLSAWNLDQLRALIAQPYGLILCVGPTGSGKTTTLHSVLRTLNQPDTKIVTAEDPVEISQAGLRQLQINPKAGLDFAAAIRSFLRADPDVIMVGEMRDRETAGIAVEAALTGHLVLSTLHTNGAPEAAARLLDMGVDPFNFSDALLGVLAQRLARRLCGGCRRAIPLPREAWEELSSRYGPAPFALRHGEWTPDRQGWESPGCSACGGTGFKGRVALHELFVADDTLRGMIRARAPMAELREGAAKAGMSSLVQDGIDKVLSGATTLAQVMAVCTR